MIEVIKSFRGVGKTNNKPIKDRSGDKMTGMPAHEQVWRTISKLDEISHLLKELPFNNLSLQLGQTPSFGENASTPVSSINNHRGSSHSSYARKHILNDVIPKRMATARTSKIEENKVKKK